MSLEAQNILGAWLSAGLTLAVLSFLYADNPFFKIAEHFYIGVSVGYGIVLACTEYLVKKVWQPLGLSDLFFWIQQKSWREIAERERDWLVLIPLVMGLLIFTRYVPRVSWLSRYTFAAVMGWTAGVAIPGAISQFLQGQIKATIAPLVIASAAAHPAKLYLPTWPGFVVDLNALLILVGVIAVLTHFFFSVEHRGPIKATARLGVIYLMLAFGAGFGSTAMGRMALLYDRAYDLKTFAAPGNYYATPVLLVGIIAGLVTWQMKERRREETNAHTSGGPTSA